MAKTRKHAGVFRPWILAILAGALVLGAGCSDDSTTEPPEEFAPPTGVTFKNGDGYVDLSWTHSTSRGVDDWNGYAVYRHTAPMSGLTVAQAAPYRLGTTVVISNTFSDNDAENGVKYYYAVRAIHGDTNFSEWSNEIHTAARAVGGEVDLAEFAYSSQPSGLDCSESTVYEMSSSNPDNRPFIDVYLGSIANDDGSGEHLALKSPHRVQNGAQAWADRVAELTLLGTGTAWDISEPPANAVWSNQIDLGASAAEIVGKVIAIKTPADNAGKHYYAKLQITAMPGQTAGERSITVRVAYQTLADYPRFVAGR